MFFDLLGRKDDRKRHEVAEERVITPDQERQFSDFGFTNPELVPALIDSHQTNSLKTATLSSSARSHAFVTTFSIASQLKRSFDSRRF